MKSAAKDKLEKILLDFRAHCRKAHLRITPQRVAVYEQLFKSKAHPSADMVHQQVRSKFPNISLDTVNRTLLTLTKLGLAAVVPSSGRAKRFDAAIQPHQHFIFTGPQLDQSKVLRPNKEGWIR